jgi:hypothetical protein
VGALRAQVAADPAAWADHDAVVRARVAAGAVYVPSPADEQAAEALRGTYEEDQRVIRAAVLERPDLLPPDPPPVSAAHPALIVEDAP